MDDEFAALKAAPWIDAFVVEHYDAAHEELLIYGSSDLSYYIDAQLRFTGVDYLSLPVYFHDAVFGYATDEEVVALRRIAEWGDHSRAFCIVSDAGWNVREQRHFVIAQAVQLIVERRKRSEM